MMASSIPRVRKSVDRTRSSSTDPTVFTTNFKNSLLCGRKLPLGGEVRRHGAERDENRRLKHIVAEQTLDIQALKAVVGKKW